MRIAVIGTGNVGAALGRRWAALGHSVIYGARRPASEEVRRLVVSCGENAAAASVTEACSDAEVVVLAVPWKAVENAVGAVAAAGPLAGRIVVDCTNPLADGLSGLAIGHTTSAAERVAELLPGARVVKAFNTTGSANMIDPDFDGARAAMFVAGDDRAARQVVLDLAQELGFDPCDAGPLRNARYLEPLAMLWIDLAYLRGRGQAFAFGLLSR